MEGRDKSRQFSMYVTRARREYGISMRQLCEGLCTSQELSLLESGKRLSNKLLQDAIVERLGIGAEDYELFLGAAEYRRWEERQRILHCITWEETERAEKLLEEYHTGCGKGTAAIGKRPERQFYLSMLALIRRRGGASREELGLLFEEAVRLTVPALEHKPLSRLTLSIKELNLILEAEQYRREGARLSRYGEVLTYIEGAALDGRGLAKIYPKAVFFLCRERLATAGGEPPSLPEMTELLRLCNRAVDILCNNFRMYFLWELLDMRGRLLEQMTGCHLRRGKQKQAEALRTALRENAEMKTVLERLYAEFQVPRETFEYCYLYVMHGVSCMNDVIRIRRQMLGITPRALCDGICDVKTLRRLERRETMPQRAIVERLFLRLGLSGEFTRTELVTDDPEARRLMENLRKQINGQQWDAAEDILHLLKTRVSMDIPGNRQALLRRAVLLHWKKGELENDSYCGLMREILEITLPFEAVLKAGEKYLTYAEQTCVLSMMQGMDRAGKEFRICMERFEDMYRSVFDNGLLEAFAGLYELIMNFVASEWGNMGEYDRSDQYSVIIASGCLRFRRLGALTDSLYNRCWNHAQRRRKGIPIGSPLNEKQELHACMVLSRMNNHKKDELFFKKEAAQSDRDD